MLIQQPYPVWQIVSAGTPRSSLVPVVSVFNDSEAARVVETLSSSEVVVVIAAVAAVVVLLLSSSVGPAAVVVVDDDGRVVAVVVAVVGFPGEEAFVVVLRSWQLPRAITIKINKPMKVRFGPIIVSHF